MTAILDNKNPLAASVFRPSALLREARRQKGLAAVDVPFICILDPDGDIVRHLRRTGEARRFEGWPCYHTTLDAFALAEQTVGIVGCAVGAPFAVLVAEQLFACGCRLLLSVTSAGQITAAGNPPYFVIIDRALRDEGTSYHYAAPSDYSEADARLVATALAALDDGRSISRNRRGDRSGAIQGRTCGGNGGCRPLRLRQKHGRSGSLPRARHQYHGPNGRRLRKGRGGRNP